MLTLGQPALSKPLPEQAQLLLVGDSRPASGQSDGAILLRIRSAGATPCAWRGRITLTTTYRQIKGAIRRVANRCAKGNRQARASMHSSKLGANGQHLLAALRAPQAAAELKCAASAAGGLGQRARASAQKPGALAAGTALLAAVGGPRGALRPAARPLGTEELNRCCSKPGAGEGCRSWQSQRRFFAPATSPRGSGHGDGPGVVPWQQPQAEQCLFSRLGGQTNQSKTWRLVHGALAEGVRKPLPALTIHKAQAAKYAAVGLVVAPLRRFGSGVALHRLTRARAGGCLGPPDPGFQAGCLKLLARRGQRRE